MTELNAEQVSKNKIKAKRFLMIFACFLAFSFFCRWATSFGPPVAIENGVGTIEVMINSGNGLNGRKVAEAVYRSAVSNHELKELVAKCIMSKENHTDKYGNAQEADQPMGEIKIDDLEEVRKFKDADTYAHQTGDNFESQLRAMPFGNELE